MKKLFILILLVFAGLVTYSQNYIQLVNKSRIMIDSIYSIGSTSVTYLAVGNLHDVEISGISFIRLGDTLLTFDKDNRPVYTVQTPTVVVPKNEKTPETKAERVTKTSPERAPASKAKRVQPVASEKKKAAQLKRDFEDSTRGRYANFVLFPFSLIEPGDMALRAGVEYELDRYHSVQGDLALLHATGLDGANVTEAFNGYAARIEYRAYLKSKRNRGFYNAFQLMYKHKRTYDGLFQTEGNKSIFSSNYKFGIVTNKSRPLYLDFYTGFGFRVTQHSNAYSSNLILPNFLLGASIGIKLSRL